LKQYKFKNKAMKHYTFTRKSSKFIVIKITLVGMMSFLTFNCNSQSKKEQIEIFTLRMDSLTRVLVNERLISKEKINELNSKESSLNSRIILYESQVSKLNTKISDLQDSLSKSKIKIIEVLERISIVEQQDKSRKPNFYIEILKVAEDYDQNSGNQSESCVFLLIEGKTIDTYFDYGTGTVFSDGTGCDAYLNGDFSEKQYNLKMLNDNTISVSKTIMVKGENEPEINAVWTKTYNRNIIGNWVLSKCIGKCKD